jgi:hypothetical protein
MIVLSPKSYVAIKLKICQLISLCKFKYVEFKALTYLYRIVICFFNLKINLRDYEPNNQRVIECKETS